MHHHNNYISDAIRYMWSDTESESDYLNFGEVSGLAVDILTSPGMLPVSLGIFGNWGAGKSSLLKLVESDLKKRQDQQVIVNFDAWLYQGYDDARAALLEVIATALIKEAESTKAKPELKEKAKSLLKRVDGFRLMGLGVEAAAIAVGFPTFGLLSKGISSVAEISDGLSGEDEFTEKDYKEGKKTSTEIIKTRKAIFKEKPKEQKKTPPQQIESFRKEYGEVLTAMGKPLIVTIDNLDRCLPENAIHTLEAIRLFLFLPNTAFIIAADEEMIRDAVAQYFKGTSNRHQIDYLDKLIQVPIRVPKAGVREITSYLYMLFAIDLKLKSEKLEQLREALEISLQQSWTEDPLTISDALQTIDESDDSQFAQAFSLADRISPILATSPIIHGNPRIVKRLLNVIRMRTKIADRRKMPLNESTITKMVIFERCAGAEATSDLYRLIDAEKGKPAIIHDLESGVTIDNLPALPDSWKKNAATRDFIVNWSLLEPQLASTDLRAAVYLSRETLPMGVYTTGLTTESQDALKTLLKTTKLSSPTALKAVDTIQADEQVAVMEGIITQLRQVQEWDKQPQGLAGAFLLAHASADAARLLTRFISEFKKVNPWMKAMLKDKQWYK